MATYPSSPTPNYPVEIEPEWTTLVSVVDTGGEQRKQKSLFPRYNVKLTYSTLTNTQLQTLWEFYQARKGAFEAFYFYDLIILTHNSEYIATGDGDTNIFDIPGKSTSSHTIYLNGSEQSEGTNYDLLVGGGNSDSDRVRFISPNGEIHTRSLTVFGSSLYAGTAENGKLYKWDGTSTWIEVAPQFGSETYILSLAVFNSNLYGGTYPNGKLLQWNGSSAWAEVAPQFGSESRVYSLAVFNSNLYGGTSPNGKLLQWNGSSAWTQAAPKFGAETYIYSLAVFNSNLYGGTYPNGKLLQWNGSSAWTEVAPKFGSETYILSLAVFNSNLYGGTSPNGNLLQWNGSSAWTQAAAKLGSETSIFSMSTFGSALYGGTSPNNHLFKYMSSSWSLVADEIKNAPTQGAIVTTDFTGYLRMRVRFMNDQLTRQMFYRAIYTTGIELKGLKAE